MALVPFYYQGMNDNDDVNALVKLKKVFGSHNENSREDDSLKSFSSYLMINFYVICFLAY